MHQVQKSPEVRRDLHVRWVKQTQRLPNSASARGENILGLAVVRRTEQKKNRNPGAWST